MSGASRNGYVLISRGVLNHPRFKPDGAFTQFEAWYWLIEAASFVTRDVQVPSGRGKATVRLQPGQLTYSVRFLAKAWGWSPARVQRFLGALQADESIDTLTDTLTDTATDTHQTIITLCNWSKYQRPAFDTDTQTDTATSTQTDTKKKEGNKERKKEGKKEGKVGPAKAGFEAWYEIYPRKTGRLAAEKAYSKAIAKGSIDPVMLTARTLAFAASWAARPKADHKFIPYPATWLNDGCYLDAPDGVSPSAGVETPKIAPVDFTETDWRDRLAYFRETGEWSSHFGPRPGAPGCLVPSNLIVTPVASPSLLSKGAA